MVRATVRRKSRTMEVAIVRALSVVIAVGLVLTAGQAAAQPEPVAQAIMYEVTEHIKFLGGEKNPEDFRRRFAGASLIGDHVVGGIEPFLPNPGKKFADAQATSAVSAKTGMGPIRGKFHILEDFDSDTQLLSTLEVKAKGTIEGTLDLSTVAATGVAPVSGNWRVTGKGFRGVGGRFQGAFAVPFCVEPACDSGYFYVDVDPSPNSCRTDAAPVGGAEMMLSIVPGGSDVAVCPVHPKEFLLGFPLTKLVLFLFLH
jgi:hypothetical protein